MTASDPLPQPALRSDLVRLTDTRAPRQSIILDRLSGRVLRMRTDDWQRLHEQTATDRPIDPELLQSARAAGLLRERAATPTSHGMRLGQLIAFRLPLLSIDPLASWLAQRGSWLLSPIALLFWVTVICGMMMSVVIGWPRFEASLVQLYHASGSRVQFGLTLLILFLFTKVIHELGHAVACRRLGYPVGRIGLFFFLGMPAPYCDVSQIAPCDSPLGRSAVMFAGIYVEWVLASIAALLWWITQDGWLHLVATNLMLVCGISTLLFNINPLMRLDGYYILSDALGTTNLRREAATAWRLVALSRLIGGRPAPEPIWGRGGFLAAYHALSYVYQAFIAAMILLSIAALLREWHLFPVGVVMITSLVCLFAYRWLRRLTDIVVGRGGWAEAPFWRRGLLVAALATLAIGFLYIPMDRKVSGMGYIDVQDAVAVYVPDAARVDAVQHEFGDKVETGTVLARLADDQLELQFVSWQSRQKVATLESAHLRRQVLRHGEHETSWKVDRANRELVETQLASLRSRRGRLTLTAPANGVLLPPAEHFLLPAPATSATLDRRIALQSQVGTTVQPRTCWCRIGDPAKQCLVVQVTDKQRQELTVGQAALVVIDDGEIHQLASRLVAIDEQVQESAAVTDRPRYLVRCELPPRSTALNTDQVDSHPPFPLGLHGEARIVVDTQPLWQHLARAAREALRD